MPEQTTVKEFWNQLSGNERVNLCNFVKYESVFNPRFLIAPPEDILFLFDGESLYNMDFESKESAMEWMESIIDDTCIDNQRFTFLDSQTMEELEQEEEYNNKLMRACCGNFEAVIRVNGRVARIGCNYGQ